MQNDKVGIWYYEPIDGARVSVWNPYFIMQLFGDACYGRKVPSMLHLQIMHPRMRGVVCADTVTSGFHSLLFMSFDASTRDPFRMGTLGLAGNSYDGKPIFALLKLNMGILVDANAHKKFELTLSPVPFGPNGCPTLPFEDNRLRMFLLAAKVALGPGNKKFREWDAFGKEICRVSGYSETEFRKSAIVELRSQFIKMGLIQQENDPHCQTYEPLVTLPQFEQIFGVKLLFNF